LEQLEARHRQLVAAAAVAAGAGGVAGCHLGGTEDQREGQEEGQGEAQKEAQKESFIDKLALVLVRDRKQLVARTRGKAAFFTPGGKRELGESDEQALRRECKEELTVDLRAGTVQHYGVFQAQAFGKPQGTVVRMTCYTADFDGALAPDQEIEELQWITSGFARERLTVTGNMILDDLVAKGLVD
jgi:8-oxo-dGTP pyrophosphatase MutT (NUDIX family)